MITVYHNKNFLDFNLHKTDILPLNDLTKVAEVDTNDPETAFRLTNNIEHSWTRNGGVTPLVSRPRSTSVGDVMEIDNESYIVVTSLGFKEIKIKK